MSTEIMESNPLKNLVVKIFTDTSYLSLLMLVLIVVAMSFAYFYLQHLLQLPPCPLCIVDRFSLVLIGFTLVIALSLPRYFPVYRYSIRLFCYLLNFLWLGIGIWASVRHIMLQYFPASQGSCLPYVDDTLIQLFVRAFAGISDCGIVLWTFLGFSIPEQTLGLFALLFVLNCILVYRYKSENDAVDLSGVVKSFK